MNFTKPSARAALHWLTYTVWGNVVGAVVFYPLGLVWWDWVTDLYWTIGGLVFNLVLLHFNDRIKDRHAR